MQRITSRHNALVTRCRAIARNEERGALLLDGAHLVGEALAAGLVIHQAIVAAERTGERDIVPIVTLLERAHVPIFAASSVVMAAVSPVRSPSALVAIADRPPAADDRGDAGPSALMVIACDVQDPATSVRSFASRKPRAHRGSLPPDDRPIRLGGRRCADRWEVRFAFPSRSSLASKTRLRDAVAMAARSPPQPPVTDDRSSMPISPDRLPCSSAVKDRDFRRRSSNWPTCD